MFGVTLKQNKSWEIRKIRMRKSILVDKVQILRTMTGSKRLTSVYGKGLNLSWVLSSFVYLKRKVFNICTLISFQNDPTTLSVLIPAGNIFSYKFVLPITIVISWLGCFYIVYIVLKKTKNLNKKILWIILKVFFPFSHNYLFTVADFSILRPIKFIKS